MFLFYILIMSQQDFAFLVRRIFGQGPMVCFAWLRGPMMAVMVFPPICPVTGQNYAWPVNESPAGWKGIVVSLSSDNSFVVKL